MRNPCVVNQNGIRPHGRQLFECCDHLLLIGHVTDVRFGPASRGANLLACAFSVLKAQIENVDLRPLSGESDSNRPSYSAAASGDDCGLSVEPETTLLHRSNFFRSGKSHVVSRFRRSTHVCLTAFAPTLSRS